MDVVMYDLTGIEAIKTVIFNILPSVCVPDTKCSTVWVDGGADRSSTTTPNPAKGEKIYIHDANAYPHAIIG
jgi:hypothetical protein